MSVWINTEESARLQSTMGWVTEMFCSAQGEGLYVGERHLFLRMSGCSATCYWCDTVASKEERPFCVVHGRTKRSLPNPLSAEQTMRELFELCSEERPARVSITGGEPLEQPEFVAVVARELKRKGISVYLETSGLEAGALPDVLSFVDIVAMDIKLPHATGRDPWDAHRDFLRQLSGKNAFVKIVVDFSSPVREIELAIRLIASIDRRVPLVLQPESTTFLKREQEDEKRKALLEILDRSHRMALEHLDDVRVIPQCHKILRVR
jgi:organic radical activating enzyme